MQSSCNYIMRLKPHLLPVAKSTVGNSSQACDESVPTIQEADPLSQPSERTVPLELLMY